MTLPKFPLAAVHPTPKHGKVTGISAFLAADAQISRRALPCPGQRDLKMQLGLYGHRSAGGTIGRVTGKKTGFHGRFPLRKILYENTKTCGLVFRQNTKTQVVSK
jgi:hypothetical protein